MHASTRSLTTTRVFNATMRPSSPAQQTRIVRAATTSALFPRTNARYVVAAANKLISKVEIPAFIPRDDISDQLLRWALIDVQDQGVANCGCPCKVTPHFVDEQLMGFTVAFMTSGEEPVEVRVAFDAEVATKHEWVGRGSDGMPTLEGKQEEVAGKNLAVTKLGETPVSDVTKASIRAFCEQLMSSINKYYAFGSCFVDDAT